MCVLQTTEGRDRNQSAWGLVRCQTAMSRSRVGPGGRRPHWRGRGGEAGRERGAACVPGPLSVTQIQEMRDD